MMLLTMLPYLYAFGLTPPGMKYQWLLYNPDEPNVHLAWMRQAFEGHLLFLDSDGTAYPCELLTDDQFRLGCLAESRLEALTQGSRLEDLRSMAARRQHTLIECLGCEARGCCQAACPARAYLLHGDFGQTDDLCSVRRAVHAETSAWMRSRCLASEEAFPCVA